MGGDAIITIVLNSVIRVMFLNLMEEPMNLKKITQMQAPQTTACL